MKATRTITGMCLGLMFVGMAGIASAQIDRAQAEYKGWTMRAWLATVGRYVEDDTEAFEDPTYGDVVLDVDGSSLGIGFGVERRFSKLLGLDLSVGYTDMDISFEHSIGEGVQEDSLGSLNIWLALNFHLINTETFDFYIGPRF